MLLKSVVFVWLSVDLLVGLAVMLLKFVVFVWSVEFTVDWAWAMILTKTNKFLPLISWSDNTVLPLSLVIEYCLADEIAFT